MCAEQQQQAKRSLIGSSRMCEGRGSEREVGDGGWVEGGVEDEERLGLRRGGVDGTDDVEGGGRVRESVEGGFEFGKQSTQRGNARGHIVHCV
jgi:hypothetical protein